MKYFVVITGLFVVVLLMSNCNNMNPAAESNMKDLDQNMLDLMMYHDNLGTFLRKGEADYSLWLLDGLDSCLQIVAIKFEAHRKLTIPFKKDYKKKLRPSIKNIREALQKEDFPAAITAYRKLTKNCNGCHIDHDIDKVVMDLSDPEYNH